MKKIFFLLLFTIASYGQAVFDEGIQITGNANSATATKVNVQEANGTINTISKSDLVNVVEVNDVPSLPLIGEAGKIYIVSNVNKIYRWNGTFYQELSVTDISGLQAQIDLKENSANKQNSLAVDGTGAKYVTVDAINSVIVNETTGVFSNIQTLINNNPAGTTINLKPHTVYLQDKALFVKESITINGNGATLKRENQITTTLSVSANQTNLSITVSSVPAGVSVGDYIQVYTDNTFNTSSTANKITNITGNVLTLELYLRHANLSSYAWPVGAVVRKVFTQFSTPFDVSGASVLTNYSVNNLIFDGNRANNSGNFYWNVNSTVFSIGRSVFSKCSFINIPNENLVGHGISANNNYAENLNGSFIHQTANIITESAALGGLITGNTVKSANLVDPLVFSGHAEGVITFSFTSGRINISNNRFLGGGAAVLGRIVQSDKAVDGSNKNFIFSNNYCENFAEVVDDFTLNFTNLVTAPDNIYISNNIFSNCGVNDWGPYTGSINDMGTIKFTGNLLTNGTVISNIPEKMKTGFLLAGGTVNNIPKYDAKGYLTAGSITDNGTNVVYTKPIYKAPSANGTTAVPVWDKNIFSGLIGSHESGIEFGNTITSNNGTMVRVRVNSTTSPSTPLYPVTFNSNGTITAPSLSGTGTRIAIADAVGNLSAPTNFTHTGNANFTGTISASPATTANQVVVKSQLDAVAARPYKVYTALVTQIGTSAPTATVLENTLGGTVVWSRGAAGVYVGTLTNTFLSGKTICFATKEGQTTSTLGALIYLGRNTNDNVIIRVQSTALGFADSLLVGDSIEIRVYN